jgi:hypothetical protein
LSDIRSKCLKQEEKGGRKERETSGDGAGKEQVTTEKGTKVK